MSETPTSTPSTDPRPRRGPIAGPLDRTAAGPLEGPIAGPLDGPSAGPLGGALDPELHYRGNVGPIERPDLSECEMAIENIGWTLGNDCPYRCTHCYSMSARRKGMDLEPWMIDRIVAQLSRLGVKTVNLGGNEPIFTGGLDLRKSLLPYIIERLCDAGIDVGLTTSGITLIKLEQYFPDVVRLLNDIDISFDSPFPEEHNRNRGATLFDKALRCLEICQRYGIDHTIIMCAMTWNFSPAHIDGLIALARRHGCHIRINPLKPVQQEHLDVLPDPGMFYRGFSRLMAACDQVDLGEPLLAAATEHAGAGCPCGRTSFRIHSITPDGAVPVSPCVYLHDYKVGDLLEDDIFDIVYSPQFRSFRRRNAHPEVIDGCRGCEFLETCRGGCAARSYLHHLFESGHRSLFIKDPYCLRDHRKAVDGGFPVFPRKPELPNDKVLVHRDYLCTWIGEPRGRRPRGKPARDMPSRDKPARDMAARDVPSRDKPPGAHGGRRTGAPRTRIDDPGYEPSLTDTGRYMLRFRYLERRPDGSFEKPVEMFRRVAWALARAELEFDPSLEERQVRVLADSFFRVMTDGEFLPNAPTLLAAGRPLGQLMACFVLPVGDSVQEIFDAVRMSAIVHSKGGGTGFSLSSVRAAGTAIASGGHATGPVSFLRVFDAETEFIKRGGTGWGANMGVLRCDHPDIREFVHAKSEGGRLQNFNLSVGVTDAFTEACRNGGEYALVDPRTGAEVERVAAKEVLGMICREAWKTGDPGLLFLDHINRDNPTPALGPIEATNPCGEAPLLPFEACCLGGVNVAAFHDSDSGAVDWAELRRVSRLALRMMDNVIEVSRYPLEEIRAATLRTRKVGIGLMGLADLLIRMGVPYGSDESIRIAEELMCAVRESTHEMSMELARKRGSFPAFEGSAWQAQGLECLRNATTTSNAPNSTISTIAGCSAGIEPLFSVGYQKNLANGDRLREVHPAFLEVARERGFTSDDLVDRVCATRSIRDLEEVPADVRELFVTADELSAAQHIRVQAAVQRHTDLGVSKTINLPRSATPDDIERAFLLAHELDCKGITCFRDGCLERQFLSSGSGGDVGERAASPAAGEAARKTATGSSGCGQCS